MIGRAPFSEADDRRLAARVASAGFEFLYPAPAGDAHGARPNALARIIDEPGDAPLADLPWDVSAPTDDRPFFYYTVRPADFLIRKLLALIAESPFGRDVRSRRTSFL